MLAWLRGFTAMALAYRTTMEMRSHTNVCEIPARCEAHLEGSLVGEFSWPIQSLPVVRLESGRSRLGFDALGQVTCFPSNGKRPSRARESIQDSYLRTPPPTSMILKQALSENKAGAWNIFQRKLHSLQLPSTSLEDCDVAREPQSFEVVAMRLD